MSSRRDHSAVNMFRPMVDGKLQYQVVCDCRRYTAIGPKAVVQHEQKMHRKEERRKWYASTHPPKVSDEQVRS